MAALPLRTVVFADLTGSTGVFESLGDEKATRAITRLTQGLCAISEAHSGRVIKTLGDGVLVVFNDAQKALKAVIAMQRDHRKRVSNWPEAMRMELQVGVASGELVEQKGDCYGDAVNVAARLSDMSGGEQIWATESTMDQLPPKSDIRCRCLGPVNIRGKVEQPVVYRIEWQDDVHSDFFTVPAKLHFPSAATPAKARQEGTITLACLDIRTNFEQVPIHLGRVSEADFVVKDPRVSRMHIKIDWRDGVFVLSDLSSYGTWVRFDQSDCELALRRQDCVLHSDGELSLGAPFTDVSVPTVKFYLAQ